MRDMHTLQWRHNEHNCVSNHQPYGCLLNRLFRRRSQKTSKLRVTGLCEGNSPVTGEFLAERAINAENVSIWRCHHVNIEVAWGVDFHIQPINELRLKQNGQPFADNIFKYMSLKIGQIDSNWWSNW